MNQETKSSIGTMLLTFLAGAAAGAVVVALTTPRTGPELRKDLGELPRRAKRKAAELAGEADLAWAEFKERTSQAADDLQRGVTESVNDLKG